MAKKRRYGDVEPIPDTPENVARALARTRPKRRWRFEDREDEHDSGDGATVDADSEIDNK